MATYTGPTMGTTRTTAMGGMTTAADRISDLDINDYSRNMFGVPFSEATAAQKSDVAAAMRADQRAATNGAVPADSEAATATRLATRAQRAADRESVRDRDDYALATYGVVFNALTPTQMEDVANYMRNDEKRAFGGVLAGGEASEAKRLADAAYSMNPPALAATDVGLAGYDVTRSTGAGYTGTTAGMATPTAAGYTTGTTVPPVGYDAAGNPVCPPGTVPTGAGYGAGYGTTGRVL